MISKYLDYLEDKKYFNEITTVIRQILILFPDITYHQNILDYYKIDKDIFLKAIDSYVKSNYLHKPLKTCNRSPKAIQDKTYLWPYYALYYALELHKQSIIIKDSQLERIFKLIFQYHICYFETLDQSEDSQLGKLNSLGIALVRVLEILIAHWKNQNDEVINLYFSSYNNILFDFLDVLSNSKEIEKYVIFPDKGKNKIKFDNSITIDTSRILYSNDNVLDSILLLAKNFQSFFAGNFNISRQKKLLIGKRIRSPRINNEDEVQQVLTHPISQCNLSTNRAEQIEQQSKKMILNRDTDDENIPNGFRQRLKNRAISANITRNNLLSSKSYNIPPKALLKEFIDFLFDKAKTNRELQIYNIIFIFGILSGQSYQRTIAILNKESDFIGINFENNKIWTKINKDLFSKKPSKDIFEDNIKKVYFQIPYLVSLALAETKRYIKQSTINYELDEQKEKYFQYLKDSQSKFYKTIHIDFKYIYKISIAYMREQGQEDISAMFCTAIYSTNETAKIAYASIHSSAEYYSDYIKNMYMELEIHEVLTTFLNLKNFVEKNKSKILENREYSGSNLLVKKTVIQSFFTKLFDLIQVEKCKYKKFNYTAIYVRYSLSLLAGTRTFNGSASLENISYEFKIMKLSEKSQTKISGLRIVPLSDTALELIKVYQKECNIFSLDFKSFYIFNNKSFVILTAVSITKLLDVDEQINEFINNIPLNFGRHIFTKYAIERGVSSNYIDAFLGHYSAGLEQFGIYSTLDYPSYINKITNLTNIFVKIYNIKILR